MDEEVGGNVNIRVMDILDAINKKPVVSEGQSGPSLLSTDVGSGAPVGLFHVISMGRGCLMLALPDFDQQTFATPFILSPLTRGYLGVTDHPGCAVYRCPWQLVFVIYVLKRISHE